MIAAYAQAHRHRGLVAAVDGKVVGLDDNDLMLLQQKSVSLNLTKAPLTVGTTEVRMGRGILRLEILENGSDHAIQSPIVLVIEISELASDAEDVVRRALATIAAIERTCEVHNVTEALDIAQSTLKTVSLKRNIALGLAGPAVVVTLVCLIRSNS